VPDRLARGIERLVDLVPSGLELHALRDLLGGDLVDESTLADLIASESLEADDAHVATSTQIPRIRPILVTLAARATGASEVDGDTQYAAEMLHMALVLHDAALGHEGGRRRRVARRLVRRSVGWIGANHLSLRALELIRSSRPDLMGELVDTLRAFSDSQSLTRQLHAGAVPTMDDWVDHADGQTGALFAFCCRAGGQMGRCEPAKQLALGRYGRHVGRMWHVAEDLAGLVHGDGEAHLMARAVAARPIYPVVALAERSPGIPQTWARLVTTPDEGDPAALLEAITAAGGLNLARQRIAQESWSARRVLRTLDESRYRAAMDRLAAGIARAAVVRRG
jgi:geranylgeranyl pyrophosphate synthase